MTGSSSIIERGEEFLLTCLLRGMTTAPVTLPVAIEFLLTCLLRGMTEGYVQIVQYGFVSTHMPLARHDDHTGTGT